MNFFELSASALFNRSASLFILVLFIISLKTYCYALLNTIDYLGLQGSLLNYITF